MPATAYLNRIATAVPAHDVHQKFLDYVPSMLPNPRARQVLRRMSDRSQIDHRYSVLEPSRDPDGLDSEDIFKRGAFPDTGTRMALFERYAPDLAMQCITKLELTEDERPSHLIITTCTGLHAPGIDLEVMRRLGLDGAVERTVIGFMGCYAAINGLKLAHHIVRSNPQSKVLLVNVELCTLHLQETENLEELLSFMVFSDGAAATLVSANPAGAEIVGFGSAVIPDSHEQITWRVGQQGFDMLLSGAVPGTVGRGVPGIVDALQNRFRINQLSLWAVQPGGRSVLDAVEQSLGLPPEALTASREVLRRYGNMSSPTVMFAIKDVLEGAAPGEFGAAMAFGPGVTAEMMLFRTKGEGA